MPVIRNGSVFCKETCKTWNFLLVYCDEILVHLWPTFGYSLALRWWSNKFCSVNYNKSRVSLCITNVTQFYWLIVKKNIIKSGFSAVLLLAVVPMILVCWSCNYSNGDGSICLPKWQWYWFIMSYMFFAVLWILMGALMVRNSCTVAVKIICDNLISWHLT